MMHREKISDHVEYPIQGLDLSKHLRGPVDPDDPPIYDLYAVCNHMGNLGGGHYTAYSLRIGGATDRKAVGASIQDVKASGRWDSDVADIYARSSVPREAALGLEALKATASDVEHAFPGYVQPARH